MVGFTFLAIIPKTAPVRMVRHVQTSESISGSFTYDRFLRNTQRTFENIVNSLNPALTVNDEKTARKRIYKYSNKVIVAEQMDNVIHYETLTSTWIDVRGV
jgi:hypothetical protein